MNEGEERHNREEPRARPRRSFRGLPRRSSGDRIPPVQIAKNESLCLPSCRLPALSYCP